MLKHFLSVLFLMVFLMSCSYFENNARKEMVQAIDTIVDFSTVDSFPLFPNCRDIPSREKQQICFQLEMSQHIYGILKNYQFNAKDSIRDTVKVKLKIDAFGKISISAINIPAKIEELLPKFDSILKVSLQNLPILEPAIKRAMPVTTEFTLPIVLKN